MIDDLITQSVLLCRSLLLHNFVLHRICERQTIVIDDPVLWASVSQSVMSVTVLSSYSLARWRHFSAAFTTLL